MPACVKDWTSCTCLRYRMRSLSFSFKLFVCACLMFLTFTSDTVQPVEIECIPLKSCPLILELLATKKETPETIEFLNYSFCGFDQWKQPLVWCSKLDFCKTPENRNGTCTPMKKCKPFLELMAALDISDSHMQNYLEKYRCNKILEGVHVCCQTERAHSLDRGEETTSNTPTFHRNPGVPLTKNIPDYSEYEDNTNFGWLGDEPVGHGNFHRSSHGSGEQFHRHTETWRPKNAHRSWNNNNEYGSEENWNVHKHFHAPNPKYDHEKWGIHKNTATFKPENRRELNPKYGTSNNKPNNTVTEHAVVTSTQSSNHRQSQHDTEGRSNINHDSPESKIRNTVDRTTPGGRRWGTSQERPTQSNREDKNSNSNNTTTIRRGSTTTQSSRGNRNNNFNYTTPTSTPTSKNLSIPTRTTPTNLDDGAIIFEDAFEDILAKRRSTTGQTTERTSGGTNRNENGSGKYCDTPDGKAGVCTKQDNCQRYLKLQNNLDKSKKSTRDYLNKFRCNSTNTREIYVCCQNDDEKDIDNSVLNVERTKEDEPEPYSKVCGRQTANNNKIFGGTTADLGEFPWLALMTYPSNKGLQFGCGGTLISSRHVLTAAHCVDERILKSKGLGKLRQVVLGEFDTRNKTDCIYMKYGEDCADPPKTFGVDSIISHNSYSADTTRHDIALVKLNQEVTFTDYIKPACLPTKNSTLYGNETFIIAGWGRTPTEPSSPILRKAKLPYVEKQSCNARNINRRFLIDGQICAGRGNGTDSCNGDSGGPIMLQISFNFELVTHVVGVISYGFGECGNGPSVNTYVPYYIDWINENMR